MASVNTVLYTSKVLKNGESPIMIRVIKDRKIKYLPVGHSCPPDLWNYEKQIPKGKLPLSKLITMLIDKKVHDAKKLILELEYEKGDFSMDDFIQRFENLSKKVSVFSFIDEIVEELVSSENIGNSEAYRNLKRVLVRFRKEKDIMFSEVDKSLLSRFEQDLRQRGLKETTMSYYFRTFRSVYNKAVSERFANGEQNPFKSYKISKFNLKTPKRAISREELRSIEALTVSDNRMLEISKDIFLFSYYTSGINIIDIAKLDDRNLKDGVIRYIRTKTKQPIIQQLLDPSIEILEKYRGQRPGNYFFPILDRTVHINEAMIKNRVKKLTKQVNAGIKQLAVLAGIDSERMTTYVARHSFATVLKKNGVPIEEISELMGHDSFKTTEIYLDNFDSDQLYRATLKLL